MSIFNKEIASFSNPPSTCSGVKDKPLRGAFGILDPLRAFRASECKRRDEERLFRLRTKNGR